MSTAAAGRTVASVVQRQVGLWLLFLFQLVVVATRDEEMSRWCVDQVVRFRAGTELNLCAAGAWKV